MIVKRSLKLRFAKARVVKRSLQLRFAFVSVGSGATRPYRNKRSYILTILRSYVPSVAEAIECGCNSIQ